jgi:ubiquinone/menaquinone biosynthesis C-methylase UbiE
MKVYGLDISSDMIELVKTKINKKNFKTQYQLEVGDAEQIHLPNHAVDYILCFRLFHLVPFDVVQKILKEFHRVVKKEVVIQIFDSSLLPDKKIDDPGFLIKDEASYKPLSVLRNLLRPIYKKMRVGIKKKKTPWSEIENFSYSKKDFEDEVINNGFSIVAIEKMDDLLNPETIYILKR